MAYTLTYELINNGAAYEVTGYTGEPIDVVIPKEYNTLPVTSIGHKAFYDCTSLTSVVIPDSVTSIGTSAFYNCSILMSVVIGDSVTSIGFQAFYYCDKLVKVVNKSTHITVTKGDSSNGYVGYYALEVYNSGDTFETKFSNDNGYIIYTDGNEKILVGYNGTETDLVLPSYITKINQSAFFSCNSLTSVVIGDSVTSIGKYAFSECSSLTSVEIGDSMTSIGFQAFYNCNSLTSVVIPDSVTSIGTSAFENCSNLMSVVIPDSVTNIGGYAFKYCSSLTSVVIGNGVTSISNSAFYNCGSLTSVVIPDSVTSINSFAFRYCSSLTSVEIGDSVTSIGDYAFQYCSSLTSVEIPDRVTSIGSSAFEYCYKLVEVVNNSPNITVTKGSSSNGWIGYYALGVYNSGDTFTGTKLSNDNGYIVYTDGEEKILVGYIGEETELVLPTYITKINQYAFRYCTSLTSVVIGDSVTTIGSDAFSGCSSLTEITLPFVGAKAGVTSNNTYQYPFGYIFGTSSYTGGTATKQHYYGSSTSSTTISTYYIPSSLKSVTITGGNILYGAFYNCSSLTSIVIGDSVTSIGECAFSWCTGLTSVVIGNSITSIGVRAFWGCTSLKNIEIPDSVMRIGNEAFRGCSSLTSVVIPDSVMRIGNSAFYNCSNLTSVVIGNSVTGIGWEAFYNCDSLKNIEIPDSVTSIDSSAFVNCSNLTSVVIPDSVTSIGYKAFYNCDSLTSVTLLSRRPASIGISLFSSNSTIYCFSDAIEKYKTATNWNTYADNFKADDMRLYFTMNSRAQKKYFATKKEIAGVKTVATNLENGEGNFSIVQKVDPEKTANVASGKHSVALGKGNTVTKDESLALGDGNTVNSDYGVALGQGNRLYTDAFGSVALGRGCEANASAQIVVGKYNQLDNTKRFIVGIGGSSSTRENGFTVDNNGRAQVYNAPINDNDVVRLKELNDKANTKLDKNTATSTYDEVYAKSPSGGQYFIKVSTEPASNSLVQRYSNGIIPVIQPKGFDDWDEASKMQAAVNYKMLSAALNAKYDKTGGIIDGDVTITGTLNVQGSTTTVNKEILEVADNIIVTNSSGTGLESTGLVMKTGNGTEAYGLMYDPNPDSKAVKIGKGTIGTDANGLYDFTYDINEAQCLATRADSITNNSLPIWNSGTNSFEDSDILINRVGNGKAITYDKEPFLIQRFDNNTSVGTLVFDNGSSGDSYHASLQSKSVSIVSWDNSTDKVTKCALSVNNNGITTNLNGYSVQFPVGKSGTLALVSDIPTVPTKTSELTNDSNYITSSSLTGYAKLSDTSQEITAKSFYAASDRRLKENIKDYAPASSILDLPIKEYNFIGSDEKQIGCIAQDLQELFPELVVENENGYLAIKESKLVYLLIKEVKALKEEVENLNKGV